MDSGNKLKTTDRLRKFSPLLLIVVGLGVGALSVIAFDQTMHMTSQNEFCMTCHTDNAGKEWMQSVHYKNSQGVVVDCASCHIPREFVPKMVVKVVMSTGRRRTSAPSNTASATHAPCWFRRARPVNDLRVAPGAVQRFGRQQSRLRARLTSNPLDGWRGPRLGRRVGRG